MQLSTNWFRYSTAARELILGGSKPTLSICALSTLSVPFANLTPDIKPIATESRKYSSTDRVGSAKTFERRHNRTT